MKSSTIPPQVKKICCAVYTRKSTDEGLDKEFNTLDAQRESAEAYVRSQAGAGLRGAAKASNAAIAPPARSRLRPSQMPPFAPPALRGRRTEPIPPPRPLHLSGQRAGPASAPYRPVIVAAWERDLSAQRIYQDLVGEHGFTGSYYSVRRFIRRLGRRAELPFRRMECEPGEEAAGRFRHAGRRSSARRRRRRTHVFRIVLSHSRKAYSEAVTRQTTEDFLRCHGERLLALRRRARGGS